MDAATKNQALSILRTISTDYVKGPGQDGKVDKDELRKILTQDDFDSFKFDSSGDGKLTLKDDGADKIKILRALTNRLVLGGATPEEKALLETIQKQLRELLNAESTAGLRRPPDTHNIPPQNLQFQSSPGNFDATLQRILAERTGNTVPVSSTDHSDALAAIRKTFPGVDNLAGNNIYEKILANPQQSVKSLIQGMWTNANKYGVQLYDIPELAQTFALFKELEKENPELTRQFKEAFTREMGNYLKQTFPGSFGATHMSLLAAIQSSSKLGQGDGFEKEFFSYLKDFGKDLGTALFGKVNVGTVLSNYDSQSVMGSNLHGSLALIMTNNGLEYIEYKTSSEATKIDYVFEEGKVEKPAPAAGANPPVEITKQNTQTKELTMKELVKDLSKSSLLKGPQVQTIVSIPNILNNIQSHSQLEALITQLDGIKTSIAGLPNTDATIEKLDRLIEIVKSKQVLKPSGGPGSSPPNDGSGAGSDSSSQLA